MNVSVFSAADANYASIVAVTWPRISAWCQAFGYTFTPITFERDCDRHPSWKKLEIMEAAGEDSVSIWMDADIFVRDLAQDISMWFPKDGIAFSSDLKGICAGFFVMRGAWALAFLRFVRWCGPVCANNLYSLSFHEQDTMKTLIASIDSIRAKVTSIPTSVVTNFEHSACPASMAWAYHAWASNWLDFPKELDVVAQRLGVQFATGNVAS